MSDCIRGTPENVEISEGDALNIRDNSIKASPNSLGPPDMCIIYKFPMKAVIPVGLQTPAKVAFFHYVIGADVSSAAAIAAYFGELCNAQEDAWFWATTKWKIAGGTYCSYDAVSQCDVRVDVKIPGGVSAFVVDVHGKKHSVTEDHWQRVSLCAVLRALEGATSSVEVRDGSTTTSKAPKPPMVKCVRLLPPIPSPAAEQRFLAAVKATYIQGTKLGSDDGSTADPATSRLATGVKKYFMDSRRYTQAVVFFKQLAVEDPASFAHVSDVYFTLGYSADALKVIGEAEKLVKDNAFVLTRKADILLQEERFDEAIDAAALAVDLNRERSTAHFILARALLAKKDFHQTLVAVNHAPLLQADSGPAPPPAVLRQTQPSILGTSPPPLDEDDPADELPAAQLKGVLKEAYSVLVELLLHIGWDSLLDVRQDVFVMEGEGSRSSSKATTPQLAPVTAPSQSGLLPIAGASALSVQPAGAAIPVAAAAPAPISEPAAAVAPVTPTPAVTSSEAAPSAAPSDATTAPATSPAAAEVVADADADSKPAEAAAPEVAETATAASEVAAEVAAQPDTAVSTADTAAVEDVAPAREDAAVKPDDTAADDASPAVIASAPVAPAAKPSSPSSAARPPKSPSPAIQVTHASPVTNEHLLGADVGGDDDIEPEPAAEEKIMCNRWMDQLFHALYADLRAYADWLQKQQQQAQAEAAARAAEKAQAAAAAIAERRKSQAAGAPALQSPPPSAAAPPTTPAPDSTISVDEWIRRARLAERLHRLADAESAYRNAVSTEWNSRAWLGLMNLYARGGHTRETLVAAEQLLRFCDGVAHPGTDHPEELQQAPSCVQFAIYQLIAVQGLQGVRDTQLVLGPPHSALNNLFHDAVRWHVHGFDM
eukprot:TRINITY_DN1833_c0_g1_i1.p1 TRINITY_DN1833_c0_g1~~TRINITY_DN1833_c0_g1_i1.p1  ORF type:complete len:885 (-),score=226.26 TRINITY_DN1833_c0_g1_i1:152-2806(-)